MDVSLNKYYMELDEFLSSKDLCDGFSKSFPDSYYNDEDFSNIANPAEFTANIEPISADQLNEYIAKTIETAAEVNASMDSGDDEGKGRRISSVGIAPYQTSSNCCKKKEKVSGKARSKRRKKLDLESEEDNSNARTSTWKVSKSTVKKCLATSVEIAGCTYTYNLTPTSNSKKPERHSVPGSLKDGKYWDRRLKNNLAAKRSRDLRKKKEMSVASRAVNLETENKQLKAEISILKEQLKKLEEQRGRA